MSGGRTGGRGRSGPLPPRWLHCPRKSVDIIGGKFIAFKTPLSSAFDDQVPVECRFTPAMLVDSMKQYRVNIGLWLDLTNTTRFYDRQFVESAGISYVKLQCRGHGEAPSEEQTRSFIHLCARFINKNPLDIIAVHCTHGFNRTGFLICSYLVDQMDWSVEAAVEAFSRARPPGIYKADYLLEIFRRYGEECDAPDAPELPDWCHENGNYGDADTSQDDDGESSEHDSQSTRSTNRHKKSSQFMEGVPGVTPVTSNLQLRRLQKRIQQLCQWTDGGFPGCQPVSMDRDNIQLLQDVRYKVSWKADGTRYMMLIDGADQIFLADRDNAIYQAHNLTFPHRKIVGEHLKDTLVDGEMVIDQSGGRQYPRFLIYDIVQFFGAEVGKTNFGTRLLCIRRELIEPRRSAMESGQIVREKEPFSVRAKEFWDVQQAGSLLSDKFRNALGHEPDGLIFQPYEDAYVCGRCDLVLKWKPPSHNSVDFRLKIVTEGGEGMLPRRIGQLFVGSLSQPFATIKVSRQLKELNGKIIECRWHNDQWDFMRERTDKSFPNALSTAQAVCNSIRHPVTERMLLDFISRHAKRPSDQDLMPPPAKRKC